MGRLAQTFLPWEKREALPAAGRGRAPPPPGKTPLLTQRPSKALLLQAGDDGTSGLGRLTQNSFHLRHEENQAGWGWKAFLAPEGKMWGPNEQTPFCSCLGQRSH